MPSLNRATLAKFLPDERSIREFENFVGNVDSGLPTAIDFILVLANEAGTSADNADSKATLALDALVSIAESLSILASAPPAAALREEVIELTSRLNELQSQPSQQVNAETLPGTTLSSEVVNSSLTTAGISSASPTFSAGDKYVIVDASGNLHVSALGPAS
jgi:hypothetical protein